MADPAVAAASRSQVRAEQGQLGAHASATYVNAGMSTPSL